MEGKDGLVPQNLAQPTIPAPLFAPLNDLDQKVSEDARHPKSNPPELPSALQGLENQGWQQGQEAWKNLQAKANVLK